MASRKTGGRRPRNVRATSNVFAMFGQDEIQEFKEAFNLIDQNHDGFIDAADLHDMFASLGKEVSDDFIEKMINEAPGQINFTMFLTLFGEKLTGTDPEEVIRNAFVCFDEDNTGYIPEERLRELLTTMGDRYSHEQVSLITINLKNYISSCRLMNYSVMHQLLMVNSIILSLQECSNTVQRKKMMRKYSTRKIVGNDTCAFFQFTFYITLQA